MERNVDPNALQLSMNIKGIRCSTEGLENPQNIPYSRTFQQVTIHVAYVLA
jgi:hypothetical protein